ncbi:Endonuclease/exonuclease/phosphatase superfamily [Sesbania bispinosa]|nr:Endonuclease/exonuclease/phosphatase superfamily [Sesbania bispinosa]
MALSREFLDDTGLMDLQLKGCKYTWCSNNRDRFITMEKLDRILVNWPWRSLFEHAMAAVLPAVSSDHSPLVFWPQPKQGSGISFKFEALWEEHEDCAKIVKEGWQGSDDISDSWAKFCMKAKNCRGSIQIWHKKTLKKAYK